ncbi:sugar transferase [Pseudozobellia thermophila]|uniref:Sugar transferase involved in LPS biosynthesis (Colanic, teichoic acid) n=1 Tax=Pseudozobellia thermophila TaxID=192903 RepID=A0A1M6BN24_9FLAO|nr:sugar transferase [Pseudozobellia thermophila]SHI50129.1 Sugar transferase involved in LPS biosynthesis (colanic, teichoic acid) [Pseudozobellia thermophila]
MPRPSVLNSVERKFILLVGDLIIVLASLNVLVNNAIDAKYILMGLKLIVFLFGITCYLALAYILEFYDLEKVSKRKYVFSQSLYVSALYVLVVFLFLVIVYDVSFWRMPLLYFLVLTPIEIGLWRLFFRNIFNVIPVTKNVLYIYDGYAKGLVKEDIALINGDEIETFYKVKLTYPLDDTNYFTKPSFVSAADKIDAYIINVRSYDELPKDLEKMLLRAILLGREVVTFTSFYENTYEALPIRSRNDSFYEILQLRNRKIRYLGRLFTFSVNFVLSIVVGLVCVLCIPMVWFMNLFFNKGPLFYTQKRVGLHGKEFKIYKFRSMVVDAEKSGAAMAKANDARITPFGKILRLFRIDELPQIISIIKGDMQFIGPRPERKVFVDQLNEMIPYYGVRHLIKPGLTGWAQVKYKYGENLEDSIRKLEYDLYYIKNKSITLDFRILFKTVSTVLFSRGV